jgi:hypothetical protein
MSDTPASAPEASAPGQDAQSAGEKAGAGAKAAAEARTPARPVSEIRADIEKERAELSRSFETLQGDLDEAVDAGRQRAADTGKKAKIAGPVLAGVVASLVVARAVFKRRSRKDS